ncbi:MAG: X2-like carbohydrate binding domain-containing protein [Dehalococcoidia bacterium]
MKKIVSILLALGLVLGLSVMAAPAGAQCLGTSVKDCKVKVDPAVACEKTATFNITFNITTSLTPTDDITVKFPAGCNVSAIGSGDVKINDAPPAWVTPISATELRVGVNASIAAPSIVRLDIKNVVLPGTEGAYKISVSTSRDVCPCEASFTVVASGTISPTAVQWGTGSGKNVTTSITWNGSKNITSVASDYGDLGAHGGNWTVVPANNTSGTTLHIAASYLQGLNLSGCQQVKFYIDFDPGCNVTLTVTVHECHSITLGKGWNLISLPIIPKYKAIGTVLADIDANVNAVWYYDCGTWYVYKNGTGFQSLTEMDAGKAYWIDMKAAANLTVCGYIYPCPPAVPPKYCYHECWNMVGFKSLEAMNVSDYTASVPAGAIIGILTWNGTAWEEVGWSNNMIVGRGYWMAFVKDACIVPPL